MTSSNTPKRAKLDLIYFFHLIYVYKNKIANKQTYQSIFKRDRLWWDIILQPNAQESDGNLCIKNRFRKFMSSWEFKMKTHAHRLYHTIVLITSFLFILSVILRWQMISIHDQKVPEDSHFAFGFVFTGTQLWVINTTKETFLGK